MIIKSRTSISLEKIFSIFISLELMFYCLNKNIYFQLSGLYIFLLIGLVFGFLILLKKSSSIQINSCMVSIILLIVQVCFTSLIYIDEFESGYFFSYISLLILFLEVEIAKIKINFQRMIINAYIYGAILIALCQIIFRTRYYSMTAARITIQLFGNPKIDPNYLAAFMIAPIFLCMQEFIREKIVQKKIMYILYVSLLLLGIFLTGSRGALLSVVVGAIYIFLVMNKRRIRIRHIMTIIIVLVVGIGIMIRYIPEETFVRLFVNSYMNDGGNVRRLSLWKNAIQAIAKQPFIGNGIQNSETIIGRIIGVYEPAHNTFLDIWLQTGILGFLSLMMLMVNAFKSRNVIYRGICLSTIICSVFIGAEACIYFWFNILICIYFKDECA